MDPFLHKFIELLMVICRELEKVMEVMARNCCMLQIQEATSRSLLTIGEPVTRLLLTASVKEDVDEATAMVNGGQTVANLPATGTARFAWQALQSYLVTAPSGHQMKSTGTLFQYNLNRSLSPLLDC
jgi:hypothetical protein